MSNLPGIPLPIPEHVIRSSFVDDKGLLSEHTAKWIRDFPSLMGGKVVVRYDDTQAKRLKTPASKFADGTQWKEGDTGLTYASVGKDWQYHSGIQNVTSDALPATLGANDAGLLVNVTDFNHVLRWNGTGWEFQPGDSSGYTQSFLLDPGAGWMQCDGSAGVATLLPDGTIDFSVNLPNTPGLWYRQ